MGVKNCEPRDFGSTGDFYEVFTFFLRIYFLFFVKTCQWLINVWIDRRLFRISLWRWVFPASSQRSAGNWQGVPQQSSATTTTKFTRLAALTPCILLF